MGYDLYTRDEEVAEPLYFRANIWAMGNLRSIMEAAGALDWDTEMPSWPDIDPELEERLDSEDDKVREQAEAEYDELTDGLRETRSEDPGKVPGFKFCSNDGWVILPEECRALAERLKAMPPEQILEAVRGDSKDDEKEWLLDYVKEYAEFCAEAAERNGFAVW